MGKNRAGNNRKPKVDKTPKVKGSGARKNLVISGLITALRTAPEPPKFPANFKPETDWHQYERATMEFLTKYEEWFSNNATEDSIERLEAGVDHLFGNYSGMNDPGKTTSTFVLKEESKTEGGTAV